MASRGLPGCSLRALRFLRGLQKFKPKQEPIPVHKWRIFQGDRVEVIKGPEAGKRGKVLEILRHVNRVRVEGVNIRRKAIKSQTSGRPGRYIFYPMAIHYSNVQLICPETNKPTKILRRYLEDGTKVRVSKLSVSEAIIPRPPWKRSRPRKTAVGAKDTAPDDVYEITYKGYTPIKRPEGEVLSV